MKTLSLPEADVNFWADCCSSPVEYGIFGSIKQDVHGRKAQNISQSVMVMLFKGASRSQDDYVPKKKQKRFKKVLKLLTTISQSIGLSC